ncbi:acyl carrier protein [Tumebacillus sp. ITR2]|uniref:Acyl carrier protein n=2 Tax=Tumebacillus amylolyticus TaxID=2801339 RepID=A0ABS1JF95_9BACL|nr:acyl carrier protein [Tumebacillus amylolyticus]
MEEQIRSFIKSNLVVFAGDAVFTDDDNIFELGYVNSLFAMQMLSYIENEFALTVDNDDLVISNFATVTNIATLIRKIQGSQSA